MTLINALKCQRIVPKNKNKSDEFKNTEPEPALLRSGYFEIF